MEENKIELADPTGFELTDDELILPTMLAERYNVIDGKFYNKKSGVLEFEIIENKIISKNDN